MIARNYMIACNYKIAQFCKKLLAIACHYKIARYCTKLQDYQITAVHAVTRLQRFAAFKLHEIACELQ